MELARTLAEILGVTPTELARTADLPVAYTNHVGMFDIAYYHNSRAGQAPPAEGSSIEDVNCVPHYDPGLLSLSIFSSAEGLQLQNSSTKQWHAGPVNTVAGQEQFGVLWLGEAAVKVSKDKLKAGVHRVIYPASTGARLTMWSEMCTVDQVNGSETDDLPATAPGNVTIPNISGPGRNVTVAPGETKGATLFKIERKLGIPMSKVARIGDAFKY